MDIWQRLGINETDDLAAIKRAYHIKLRTCHPEDDPEGFRLLREAYETACRPRPAMSEPPELPVNQIHSDETPELTALLALLGDASRRFVPSEWDKWQTSLQVLSLVQQNQLSDDVLQHIFEWQWLPSPLIERLWQSLDWAALLRLTGDMQKRGEFLDWWRKAPTPVPLAWLATLDHARQRAVLAFYQPLLLSLEASDRNSILGLIHHYPLPIVGDHPDLIRLQLRALRAINDDSNITHRLALTLALLEQEQLSEDDWYMISDSALRCGKAQLVMQVAKALEEHQYDALLANHLIQWYLDRDQPLARWLQALARTCHWPTTCSAFWEPQWLMQPLQQPDQLEEWLNYQMLGVGEAPLTSLAFETMPGVRGALARLWWSCEYGTWQSLEAALADTLLASAEGDWSFLARLLQRHAHRRLTERPALPLLDNLLDRYGNDDWLSVAPPSADHIACATPAQWVDYLRRYPLMPDEWFQAIAQRANDEGWQNEIIQGVHLGARLSHQRIYSNTGLGDAWHGEGWAGCFRWAQFYYAYAWTPRDHLDATRHALGALSPDQDDTPLTTVLRLSAQPTIYQVAIIAACARWPDQYVLAVELRNQTDLLRNSEVSDQSLLDRAKANDLTALAALIGRRLDNDTDLASTIVLWNLLLCHKESNDAYSYLLTPLHERLIALRRERGLLSEDGYPYSEESLIYAYLHQKISNIATVEELGGHHPDETAAKFVYPACYGLAILAYDFSESGFQADRLAPLCQQQADLTAPQQEAASLLLVYLEDKLNDQLEHDRHHAKDRFRRHSGEQLMFISSLSAIPNTLMIPIAPSLWEMLTARVDHWYDYITGGSQVAAILALNVYLMIQLCHYQVRLRSGHGYLFGSLHRLIIGMFLLWNVTLLALTLLGNIASPVVLIWGGYILMCIRFGPTVYRWEWPKKFYLQGRITLSDLFS